MTPSWWNEELEELYELAAQASGELLGEIEALIEVALCRASTLHMGVKLSGGDVFKVGAPGGPGGSFLAYRHVVLLCEHLDRLRERTLPTPNLMVLMPFQEGKSTTCSKIFPVNYLANLPDDRVLLGSYEATMAARWGRRVRNLIARHSAFLGLEVSSDSKAVDRWEIAGREGGMICAGVGGGLTGEPGDLIVIDDPVKNAKDAASQQIQEDQWDWYTQVVHARRQVNTAKLLAMTRWHESDLGGRILDAEPDEWTVLRLPALAEDDDPLGRKPGEALSERHPLQDLLKTKKLLSTYAWSAGYQQSPTTPEGTKFKRADFRYWTLEEADGAYYRLHRSATVMDLVRVKDCVRFATMDVAATTKTTSDWSVISVWDLTPPLGEEPPALVLVDRYRERVETHQPMIRRAHETLKPLYIGVEKATYGLEVIRSARRAGLPVRKLKIESDKVSRSETAQTWLEQHRVFFPRHSAWLDVWEHELLFFPVGRHDDQVDTFGYAAIEADKLGEIPRPRARGDTVRARLHAKRRPSGLHPELGRV